MNRQKKSIYIIGLIFLLGMFAFLQGKAFGLPAADSITDAIPVAFQQKLDSLKSADQLEGWLNTWYDFLSRDPSAHYHELRIPLKTIWRKPQTDQEKVAWFYLLIFAGYYELQQGNILKSTDVYEQAYRFIRQANAVHDNEVLEYLIKPLGNNYTRLGDYERALFIQKKGLQLAQRMNKPMQEAASYANLSTTARWNDQLKKALQYADEGLEKATPETALQGLLYSTKADILQQLGQDAEAQKDIQKAVDFFSHTDLQPNTNKAYWFAGALMTAGDIAQKQKSITEADRYYKHALSVYRHYFPDSRHREKMKVKVELGNICIAQNNEQSAITYFNDVLQGLIPDYNERQMWPVDSMLYAENTLLDALTGKAKALQLADKGSLALGGYKKASVVVQQLRETIFSREARRLLQQESLQMTEDAVTLAYHLYKKTNNLADANIGLQFVEQQKSRLLLNDLQKNISYSNQKNKDSLFTTKSRLRQAIAFYTHAYVDAVLKNNATDSLRWKQKIAGARYRLSLIVQRIEDKYPVGRWKTNIKIEQLYTSFPDSTVGWEYLTGTTHWYGFEVGLKGVKSFKLLGEADSLKSMVGDFVNHWFEHGPDNMINRPQSYFMDAYSIYEKISLNKHLKDKKLLIIPDGMLGKLPFEALITDSVYLSNPARWPYLLMNGPAGYSYSLSVWHKLQNEFPALSYKNRFAGFFITPGKDQPNAVLTGVRQEVKSIQSIVQGRFYENNQATAQQLLQSVQQSEVLHVSTHAFLLGAKAIPALQMAGQQILLADLYPLGAHPALVVMSACQTADGLLSPGEGIISLAREWIAVGAGGVVAGLWNINDEVAARLTALFYKNLQQSGNKANSLYQAKREWLSDTQQNAVLKLPYYWAGLVYYGNHLALTQPLHQPSESPWWRWIGMVILLVILGWWGRKRLLNKKERSPF